MGSMRGSPQHAKYPLVIKDAELRLAPSASPATRGEGRGQGCCWRWDGCSSFCTKPGILECVWTLTQGQPHMREVSKGEVNLSQTKPCGKTSVPTVRWSSSPVRVPRPFLSGELLPAMKPFKTHNCYWGSYGISGGGEGTKAFFLNTFFNYGEKKHVSCKWSSQVQRGALGVSVSTNSPG